MSQKVEYLAVDFDAPPPAEQLANDFGSKGWGLVSLLPVTMISEESNDPVHKLRGYFVKVGEGTRIMVPGR